MKGYCKECEKEVILIPKKVSHILHFFLTLITSGFWSWIWIYLAIKKTYICKECQTTNVELKKNKKEKVKETIKIVVLIIASIILMSYIFSGISELSDKIDEAAKEAVVEIENISKEWQENQKKLDRELEKIYNH